MFKFRDTAPVDALLPELSQSLEQHNNVILSAQPGAGKTTRVPIALLDEPWLKGQKILMLEPRRAAARNAALFMASTLGEDIGRTVGYRMRLDHKVSSDTRIEVITEGILNRYLNDDPELSGIGLIIFDEHHERSLNTDLGLALTRQSQQIFREDLRILVMSATLDAAPLSDMLNAPVLKSDGRQFSVDIRHQVKDPQAPLSQQMAKLILSAVQKDRGSVLAFLPGAADIRKTEDILRAAAIPEMQNVRILPLYGQLSDREQQEAIRPAENTHRKIVLATNIAESSLTIEGIRIVVDSGQEKQLQFHPRSGMNSLVTRHISKASAIQRAGRAGRLEDGICYRLWSETVQDTLEAFSVPEVERVDLSDLILQCAAWGASPNELEWLTPPPEGALLQAADTLLKLDLIDPDNQLTPEGLRCSEMGMSPRTARLLSAAAGSSLEENSALLAAFIQEPDKSLRNEDDLSLVLGNLKSRHKDFRFIHRQASAWRKRLKNLHNTEAEKTDVGITEDWLLAKAFPDRIARLRDNSDGLTYQMSNGRSANLRSHSGLARTSWLIITHAEDDQSGSSIIRQALPTSESVIRSSLENKLSETIIIKWNDQDQLIAEKQQRLFSLIIEKQPLKKLSDDQWQSAWGELLTQKGLTLFPWSDEARILQQRVNLMHSLAPDEWPDFSDQALTKQISGWLLPHLLPLRSSGALKRLDPVTILNTELGWDKLTLLNTLAPLKIQVPSGSSYSINYSSRPPVLAVKLQEMFGYADTPAICEGRIPLMLHLLSPAQRPLQVTQDLAGFWKGSYSEVRKEMRGRYPKHPWPEDPASAEATRLTKRRLAENKTKT